MLRRRESRLKRALSQSFIPPPTPRTLILTPRMSSETDLTAHSIHSSRQTDTILEESNMAEPLFDDVYLSSFHNTSPSLKAVRPPSPPSLPTYTSDFEEEYEDDFSLDEEEEEEYSWDTCEDEAIVATLVRIINLGRARLVDVIPPMSLKQILPPLPSREAPKRPAVHEHSRESSESEMNYHYSRYEGHSSRSASVSSRTTPTDYSRPSPASSISDYSKESGNSPIESPSAPQWPISEDYSSFFNTSESIETYNAPSTEPSVKLESTSFIKPFAHKKAQSSLRKRAGQHVDLPVAMDKPPSLDLPSFDVGSLDFTPDLSLPGTPTSNRKRRIGPLSFSR